MNEAFPSSSRPSVFPSFRPSTTIGNRLQRLTAPLEPRTARLECSPVRLSLTSSTKNPILAVHLSPGT